MPTMNHKSGAEIVNRDQSVLGERRAGTVYAR